MKGMVLLWLIPLSRCNLLLIVALICDVLLFVKT